MAAPAPVLGVRLMGDSIAAPFRAPAAETPERRRNALEELRTHRTR